MTFAHVVESKTDAFSAVGSEDIAESFVVADTLVLGDLEDNGLGRALNRVQQQEKLVDAMDGVEQRGSADVQKERNAVGELLRILERPAPAHPVEIANVATGSSRLEHGLHGVHGRKSFRAYQGFVAQH